MKELIFLRHAKSSWDNNLDDRNRPLSEKGVNRIVNISRVSKRIFTDSEIIYSSPAIRAISTSLIMMNILKINFSRIVIKESLYSFDFKNILDFIGSIDNKYKRVLFVGHNPALTECINLLGDKKIYNLPTSAWGKITFNQSNWIDIKSGLTILGMPKKLLT